jgi:hypothetical protein
VCSFASKSFAAVREALSRAYPDKVAQNRTTVHPLVKKSGSEKVFVCEKCSSSDRTVEIMALPISSSALPVTTGYGCKNSILTLVSLFYA